MKSCSVKRKTIALKPEYLRKISRIKEKLGASSDSEVIRRAIDNYAEKLGIFES